MEDTIKLPLDADGVPIRPGDVVYDRFLSDPKPLTVRVVQYNGNKLVPWDIFFNGRELPYVPSYFTHTKPDTLEDIEQSIRELAKRAELKSPFELEIITLMERIKRMVER